MRAPASLLLAVSLTLAACADGDLRVTERAPATPAAPFSNSAAPFSNSAESFSNSAESFSNSASEPTNRSAAELPDGGAAKSFGSNFAKTSDDSPASPLDDSSMGPNNDSPERPYPQRPGDAQRGRQLFVDNGTPEVPYMSCGVPEQVVRLAGLDRSWASAPKIPDRRDKDLPYDTNYVVRPSGVKLVATNCLFCHAATLGTQLVIGLPEVNRDFTKPDPLTGISGASLRLTADLVLSKAAETELARIVRVVDASAKFPRPDTIGINPADSLFGVLAMHRDPVTLTWQQKADSAAGPIPERIIFTDVPALWNTHRRPRLFQTGFARGDLARVMMTASLLCLEDSAEAAKIDAYFPDVQAYINSLRAPKYEAVSGRTIDGAKAERGRSHYESQCQSCHGGKDGEGPEPLAFVALEEVGTDPIYARVTTQENGLPEGQTINYFFDFFNRSWYGQHGSSGTLERSPVPGYVPPPLDGIWATAPYFHNGSVPTLEAVLDPGLRPAIFRRSFNPAKYDFERLGYPFERHLAKLGDPSIYDTTQLGNSNRGHTFGASLSKLERAELLEYLKTF